MDSEDEAAAQLQGELSAEVLNTFRFGSSRPILKHLNADTSWLLSLPFPPTFSPPLGRCRYNVLIDPWFRGEQHDIAAWFSTQWHATPSNVQTIVELNDFLQDGESRHLDYISVSGRYQNARSSKVSSFIDLVICSHEFEDHTHESTLKELDSTVPVLAAKRAVPIIKSWKHFDVVVEIPKFKPGYDWRRSSISFLPSFLSLARLEPEMFVQLHSALLIMIGDINNGKGEMVVYTPHGAEADAFKALSTAKPPLPTLALIHGLTAVSLAGAPLNLGLSNGIKAQSILRSRYWIATHDEEKHARGLVAPLLRWYPPTYYTCTTHKQENTADPQTEARKPDEAFVKLENGQCLILE